jgi:hypothetical protein
MRNLLCILGMVLAVPAVAEPISTKDALKQVFSDKKSEVRVLDPGFLSETDKKVLVEVGGQQKYYAAIAMAPKAGLIAETTVAGANFHNLKAARALALKGCEAKRKGGSRCVVVAEVTPVGWSPRDFQLSMDATSELKRAFKRMRAPKAFAISPSTGAWAGIKGDAAAAKAACAASPTAKGGKDCAVIVLDQ